MQKKIVRRAFGTSNPADPSESWDHIPGFLRRAYWVRGVNSLSDLDYTLAKLATTSQLKGVGAASKILADAIEKQRNILIVGDFDCDGATSTSVAVLALKALAGIASLCIACTAASRTCGTQSLARRISFGIAIGLPKTPNRLTAFSRR